MNRQVTFLTDKQLAALKAEQRKTGVPVSTQIRIAVEESLKRKKQ